RTAAATGSAAPSAGMGGGGGSAWWRRASGPRSEGTMEIIPASQGLEVLDEVGLLPRVEPEQEVAVIVVHHVRERGRAPVVEVRRVLPGAPERGGAVAAGRRPLGQDRAHPGLLGEVQPVVRVG